MIWKRLPGGASRATLPPMTASTSCRARLAPRSGSAVALIVLSLGTVLAGPPSPTDTANVQAVLRAQLELSDSELSALNQGRPIVKTLPSTANREMTTVGGVRIRGGAMMRFVDQFKTLEGFRTSQFMLQIGKFADTPQLSDLDALTLDADDIESLRTCRVAACDVQLAADDIIRFNREVDWRSPAAAQDATALYKRILFAHLTGYRRGGTDRLVQYGDRDPGVRLAIETEALLDAKPSLLDHSPVFQRHVRRYPADTDASVEDFFYWSKEAFGFKPVIGLNHVSVYTDASTGKVIIVTTQIYASHYMDGSIGINALMPDHSARGESAFYWVYLNRSRVGRLGGFLGTLSRPIVQRRARSGLLKSLLQTKQRFEAAH
jgi:hypothetical protein